MDRFRVRAPPTEMAPGQSVPEKTVRARTSSFSPLLRNPAAAPLATAIGYFLAAKLGAWLAFPSAPVSALWAPNAILLAALLLADRRRWWAYLLAVLPFHLLAQLPGFPASQVVIQYVVNVAEALLGAWTVQSFCAPSCRFDRALPALALVALGGFFAPAVTSILMAGAFAIFAIPGDFSLTVTARTITNTFAVVTLVPLIVHIAERLRAGRPEVSPARIGEGCALALGLVSVSALVFGEFVHVKPWSFALLFAPLPFLAWAAVRFGVTGACGAALLMGAVSTWAVLNGSGPFSRQGPVDNALTVTSFHVVTTVLFFMLAALIEEWKRAAAALRESEARSRDIAEHNVIVETRHRLAEDLHSAVLGSLHDEIAVLDDTGTVIEINDSWRRAVETAHPARHDRVLPGDSFLQACAGGAERGDEGALEQLNLLRTVLSGSRAHGQIECVCNSTADPSWVEISIEKLHRPEGGVVVTRTDVTPRKRAEMEARDQRMQLTHLGRAAILGQLSGAFAHELNQPLTSILGNAEAALRILENNGKGAVSPIGEILQDIVDEDLRAAQVIQRLRALLDKGDIVRRPVNLNTTIREVLNLSRSELITRNVRVTTQLDAEVPLVLADQVQMQQVVLNLLLNACEAMHATPAADRKAEVTTRFIRDDKCVEISIRDSGCGVPPDDLERIFQPFMSTKLHGMGLGLAICRSVVESHRGHLWAENGAEHGAIFHLKVPVEGGLQ